MPERSKIHDIVERHLVAFDPDLTFDQNCMDSMCMVNIMVDIQNELGIDVMEMAEHHKLPETLQELEVVVLQKMMSGTQ
jgi:acyl carrier protein